MLSLFESSGPIVAAAMMLAGIFALAMCVRAGLRGRSPQAVRLALLCSFVPLAVGICGSVTGTIFALAGGNQQTDWQMIGKVTLAGYVVSAIPLLWSAAYSAAALKHAKPQ